MFPRILFWTWKFFDDFEKEKYVKLRIEDPIIFVLNSAWIGYYVKFGLSEKHKKFEKIFLMVLTNQLIY